MRPQISRLCSSSGDMLNILSCSKAAGGSHRCNPSLAMMTSPHEQNTLERDVKQQTNKTTTTTKRLTYPTLLHSYGDIILAGTGEGFKL